MANCETFELPPVEAGVFQLREVLRCESESPSGPSYSHATAIQLLHYIQS